MTFRRVGAAVCVRIAGPAGAPVTSCTRRLNVAVSGAARTCRNDSWRKPSAGKYQMWTVIISLPLRYRTGPPRLRMVRD